MLHNYILHRFRHLPPGLSLSDFFPLLANVVHMIEPLSVPPPTAEVTLSSSKEFLMGEHASLSLPSEALLSQLSEVILIFDKANK